jgi:ANTAR domain-containing protein
VIGSDECGRERPADVAAQLRQENEQLRTPLASRIAIEQAKGVLAERLEVSVEEAFALLRYSARSERMQIQDLAVQVFPATAMPQAIIRGLARESRWRALAVGSVSRAYGSTPRRGPGTSGTACPRTT